MSEKDRKIEAEKVLILEENRSNNEPKYSKGPASRFCKSTFRKIAQILCCQLIFAE